MRLSTIIAPFALCICTANAVAPSSTAAACAPLPAGLTSWWTADGIAEDVFSGFDATLLNGANYGGGMVGQSFVFDGVDDYVRVPHEDALNFGTDDFTLVFWLYADTLGEVALSKATYDEALQPAPLRGWAVYPRQFSNNLDLQMSDANLVVYQGTSVNTVSADEWIHVAIRRQDGDVFSIFLDGVLQPPSETPPVSELDNEGPLLLGCFLENQGFFEGRLDEVQVFAGTALSDAEIISIFNAGSDGVCGVVPACGNGRAEIGESCDDGNQTAGDSCESDCTLSCGNGVITFVEQCDDNNLVDGDGCDSNCRDTACGNGIVTAGTGEVCDDGNALSGDGCDSNCRVTACGNGVASITTGEVCDDGNLDDGDGCESDCTLPPVDVIVPPGGTATTDPNDVGATPQYPKQISIQTPNGGQVTIDDVTDTVAVDGMALLGVSVQIEAPAASVVSPLVVTLTVDASVIPPGVDLTQIQGLRNRVPLEECISPAIAAPDPCMADLSVTPEGDIEIVMLTSQASLWQVGVRGLRKPELGCVNAMNGAGFKVVKTLAKVASNCLKGASSGEVANAQTCLTADADGKVGKALGKTIGSDGKKCVGAAPFGYTGSAAVNAAAQAAALAVVADVFGSDLTAAVAAAGGEAGAKCQAGVLKAAQKLFETRAKLFLTCAKGALSGKTNLAVSGLDLSECFDEVEADPKGKLDKLIDKLKATLASTCGEVTLATALPGTCFSGNLPAKCLDRRSMCHMCVLFEGMGDLGFDCDTFDDGDLNGSCS